jgi:hypothetical protein
MYRDSANALDEHDRAVGAILISEALVDECEKARAAIRRSDIERNERWRTITSVHDTYPEVWRHLDRARKLLAGRGANTASYDEHRPLARRAATNADGTDIELAAIQDARRAIEELKLAVPGADWAGIHTRTAGLVETRLSQSRGQRGLATAVLAVFVIAVATWGISIIPEHKIHPREQMRRELVEVAKGRKQRIVTLRFELGLSCDGERARELTKLLAFEGRVNDAHAFGTSYIARCGADTAVEHWANAPAAPRL